MIKTARIMIWEFWRENRGWWICLMGSIFTLSVFMHFFLAQHLRGQEISPIIFFVFLIAEAKLVLFFLFMKQYDSEVQRLGFPLHYYMKPVSTISIVLWRLLLSVATMISIHGFLVLTHQLAVQVTIPFWKPALILSLSVVLGHALVWHFPNHRNIQTLCATLALTPCIALLIQWFNLPKIPTLSFLMNKRILMHLFKWIGVSIIIAYLAVRWERHGTPLMTHLTSYRSKAHPQNSQAIHIRTPLGTLYHLEMKRKGWQFAVVNLCGFLILFLFWQWDILPLKAFASFVYLGGIINLFAIPIIVGFMYGQHDKTHHLQIETYKATKPVSNNEFLKVYFLTSLSTLALTWFAFILGPALFGLYLLVTNQAEQFKDFIVLPEFPIEIGPATFLMPFLFAWTLAGLSATIMFTGRYRLVILCWLGIWLIPATLGLLIESLPEAIEPVVGNTVLFTVELGIIAGIAIAFWSAYQRNMLSTRAFFFSIGAFLLLSFVLMQGPSNPGLSFYRDTITLATIIIAPIATAPLAFAWNRHR